VFQGQQPATLTQDPAGFEQCSTWVRDRAQTQGEDDRVEAGLFEWQLFRTRRVQLDLDPQLGRLVGGPVQHAATDIEQDQPADLVHAVVGQVRSGAGSRVENSSARGLE
jgi:hypothetical protein